MSYRERAHPHALVVHFVGLHRHRHLLRPGLPEFLFVAAVLATAATGLWWWRSALDLNLSRAPGSVLACRIISTHFNAPANRDKVVMTYEYTVAGIPFVSSYAGFWPEAGGPNALHPDEVKKLTSTGYPLTVLYDPGAPSISWLHQGMIGAKLPRAVAFCVTLSLTLLYCFRGYPAWRRR